jgi:regulator of protease activity HflC (stomatin/prohibitin superfamily)
MKKVTIEEGLVGLVYRKGKLQKVVEAGVYWFFFGETVVVYRMDTRFIPNGDFIQAVKNELLRERLNVFTVRDFELAIVYENGLFKTLLQPGSYAYWKSYSAYTFQFLDRRSVEVTSELDRFTLKRSQFVPFVQVCKIESFERGLLYFNGKFEKILEAGEYYFWKGNVSVSVTKADMRQIQMEISGQEILTKDKAAIRLTFFVQYQIIDLFVAIEKNKDYEKQLYTAMQFALREYIGNLTLDEVLAKRESITAFVKEASQDRIKELGLTLKDCGVRDIILPGEMKEILNQVLIAEKKAQSNIIMRREETASTRSLLNTAKLMEENAVLMKLKEMEYVERIAEKIGEITISGNGQVLDQLKNIFTKT